MRAPCPNSSLHVGTLSNRGVGGRLPREVPTSDPLPRKVTPRGGAGQKRGAGSLTRAAKAAREQKHSTCRERPGGGRAAPSQGSLHRWMPTWRCQEEVRRVPGPMEWDGVERPSESEQVGESGANKREGEQLRAQRSRAGRKLRMPAHTR